MEELIVTPEKIVSGGDCLAKVGGKNVFIPFAIPGEKIKIQIEKEFRDYDTAKIVSVIEPSPDRVMPFCPLYGTCGGCNMQHINIEAQIKYRAGILKACFERENIACPEIKIISGREKNYRSRIQLTDGGFCKKKSNEIVGVNFCPVATDSINGYLESTENGGRPSGRVHIFGDSRVIQSENCVFPGVIAADETKTDFWKTKKIGKSKKRLKNKVRQRFAGTVENAANACSVMISGKKIEFNVKGFFQSNIDVLEKTIGEITKNTGGENALDMYCGSGTFSVFLSDFFKNVYMVEHNRDAVVYAEKNMAGRKHETYGVSGSNWVSQNAADILSKIGKFDAVVIDPPRSGMEKEVRRWLCEHKTPQIRSVSCDPVTHARDAKFLIDSGYMMTDLYLLDFYPQTSHIESLAFFEYTE